MCKKCEVFVEAMNANDLVTDLTMRNASNEEMQKARSRQHRASYKMMQVVKRDYTKPPGEQWSIGSMSEYLSDFIDRNIK